MDVLRLVDEVIIQREAEQDFQDFHFDIGFHKITIFEVFWLGVAGDGQLDRLENSRFDFFSQTVAFVFGKYGD